MLSRQDSANVGGNAPGYPTALRGKGRWTRTRGRQKRQGSAPTAPATLIIDPSGRSPRNRPHAGALLLVSRLRSSGVSRYRSVEVARTSSLLDAFDTGPLACCWLKIMEGPLPTGLSNLNAVEESPGCLPPVPVSGQCAAV